MVCGRPGPCRDTPGTPESLIGSTLNYTWEWDTVKSDAKALRATRHTLQSGLTG